MPHIDTKTILILSSLPLISGLIGYVTNRIALWMLFHPRREKRFIGFSFHGLVPSHQKELAHSVAETVTSHLVTPETVADRLQDERVHEALVRGLSDYGRRYVADLLDSLPSAVLILLPRDIEDKINRRLEKSARKRLPEFVQQIAPAVAQELDFAPAIESEVAGYPPEKVEEMVRNIARKELRAIEMWGGVLGFIIGLLQSAVIFFLR